MWSIFKRKSEVDEDKDNIMDAFPPAETNESSTKMQDVYEAMHFIFTDLKHPGYSLKSLTLVGENEYEVMLSDGYKFIVKNETFETLPIKIADEFNRHYREDICHFI